MRLFEFLAKRLLGPAAARQEEDERRTGPADPEAPEPTALPIDGTLDLHTFRPADVRELVPEYLTGCLERGIFDVRIVHGKGTGALRRTVEALLQRDPRVESFRTAAEDAGGWGATLVRLKPLGYDAP